MGERYEWRLGVRLGPTAAGELSQHIYDLPSTHPGIRRSGLRGVMDIRRCRRQVGYPPSVATDAQLGLSVMAYQSAELLLGQHLLIGLLIGPRPYSSPN